jgi:hypothetical protein
MTLAGVSTAWAAAEASSAALRQKARKDCGQNMAAENNGFAAFCKPLIIKR